ncbi:MAG: hypothetical protein JO116_20095 [Planctomycetaceae bacterium]|nr:hypothetical protein [Planctomycetaceae bacterium]
MARFTKAYQSRFMKAVDLPEDASFVIQEAREMELGQGSNRETKVVLIFSDHDQWMVLNKTNYNTIVSMFGNDLDDWAYKSVTLTVEPTTYQGEVIDSIRIKRPAHRTSHPAPSRGGSTRQIPDIPPVQPVEEAEDPGF